jgi:hypothetical protein
VRFTPAKEMPAALSTGWEFRIGQKPGSLNNSVGGIISASLRYSRLGLNNPPTPWVGAWGVSPTDEANETNRARGAGDSIKPGA